jgi:hypothetical protein
VWVSGEAVQRLLIFVILLCVWVCFCCCSYPTFVRDDWRLGLCEVGIVDWSVDDQCEGEWGSLVTS